MSVQLRWNPHAQRTDTAARAISVRPFTDKAGAFGTKQGLARVYSAEHPSRQAFCATL